MALQIGGKISIGPGVTMTSQPYSVIGSKGTSPYVAAYTWLPGSGVGTKYADPTVTPAGGQYISFSPNGRVVFLSFYGSPYIQAYRWTPESGFGTKYADPSVLPIGGNYAVNAIELNPAGTAVAMAAATGAVIAYRWSDDTGFGTRYTTFTPFANAATCLDWSPSGDAVVFGGNNNNASKIVAYKWSDATGFGTSYTPSINMDGSGTFPSSINQVSFSPAGNAVVWGFYGGALGPPFMAYSWNSSTGWGTQYSSPVSPGATTNCNGVSFTPDGAAVIYSLSTNSTLGAYAWSYASGLGTKYAAPSTLATGSNDISMLADGTAFALGTSSNILIYEWNSTTGFGKQYVQSGAGGKVAFSAVSTS